MKRLLLILLIIVGIFESCKKYEDGPLISLRSTKNRLYGAYTLTQYTVDGVDSLSLYTDKLGLIFSFYFEDVNSYDLCAIDRPKQDGGFANLYWRWKFIDNNKTLSIYKSTGTTTGSGPSDFTGPFGDGKLPQWEILRLTNKEVKMKTTYNDKEYFIDLIAL